jgi:hypothetical protein
LLREKYENISPEKKIEWDSVLFNQIEYISFLVNKGYLKDSKMIEFLRDPVVDWYDNVFSKFATEEERTNLKFYPEWKQLYAMLKKKESQKS